MIKTFYLLIFTIIIKSISNDSIVPLHLKKKSNKIRCMLGNNAFSPINCFSCIYAKLKSNLLILNRPIQQKKINKNIALMAHGLFCNSYVKERLLTAETQKLKINYYFKDERNAYHCEQSEFSTKIFLDYLSLRAKYDENNFKLDQDVGTCLMPVNSFSAKNESVNFYFYFSKLNFLRC